MNMNLTDLTFNLMSRVMMAATCTQNIFFRFILCEILVGFILVNFAKFLKFLFSDKGSFILIILCMTEFYCNVLLVIGNLFKIGSSGILLFIFILFLTAVIRCLN
jgi:hypothetical protein